MTGSAGTGQDSIHQFMYGQAGSTEVDKSSLIFALQLLIEWALLAAEGSSLPLLPMGLPLRTNHGYARWGSRMYIF